MVGGLSLFVKSLSTASSSLLFSNSLCLASKTSFISLVVFSSVSVCFSLVLTRPSSILDCSCWKEFGEVGIGDFFLVFLGILFSEVESEDATTVDTGRGI